MYFLVRPKKFSATQLQQKTPRVVVEKIPHFYIINLINGQPDMFSSESINFYWILIYLWCTIINLNLTICPYKIINQTCNFRNPFDENCECSKYIFLLLHTLSDDLWILAEMNFGTTASVIYQKQRRLIKIESSMI
jgi:hypothetical protein